MFTYVGRVDNERETRLCLLTLVGLIPKEKQDCVYLRW